MNFFEKIPHDMSNLKYINDLLNSLPEDPFQEEDFELAEKIFELSEKSDIAPDTRDFLLDVMLFCKGLPGPFLTKQSILDEFSKKINPV